MKNAGIMRDLDVALSIFDVLEALLENSVNIKDLHYLAAIAGEDKRKLETVVDVLADRS